MTSCESYLRALRTYVLALSKAGARPHPDKPAAENLGDDSSRFVLFPLDLGEKYIERARWASEARPASKRLAWLQRADHQERSEWCRRFRSSSLSLGQVVAEIYKERDAHWSATIEVSDLVHEEAVVTFVPTTGTTSKAQGQSSQSPRAARNVAPSSAQTGTLPVSDRLRDGTKLCSAWQVGACNVSGSSCKLGAHRCGVVRTSGRVCGDPRHGANRH